MKSKCGNLVLVVCREDLVRFACDCDWLLILMGGIKSLWLLSCDAVMTGGCLGGWLWWSCFIGDEAKKCGNERTTHKRSQFQKFCTFYRCVPQTYKLRLGASCAIWWRCELEHEIDVHVLRTPPLSVCLSVYLSVDFPARPAITYVLYSSFPTLTVSFFFGFAISS